MTNKTLQLDDRIHEYLLAHSVSESAIQRELREETARLPQARMQIAPEQGAFMALLVRLMNARKTLDVGVFTGYSALTVASALPADGCVVGLDISREWTDIARRYWQKAGVAERIDLRLGPALETLDQLLKEEGAESYDFAFIDADKSNYLAYYERCLQLLRPGGLIAIDNVLWSGRVADPAEDDGSTRAIRDFNARIREDKRVMISMVPIADGLTLALKLGT